MKFLCVECDVPMVLKETRGPDNGSMTVLFSCRSCGREIAMLTNEMETQMVHSLGVKIGGRRETAPPMETISSSLAGYAGTGTAPNGDGSNGRHAGADFGAEADVDTASGTAVDAATEGESKGGCPFSEMVAGSMDASHGEADSSAETSSEKPIELRWTAEARHRMDRIPSFVRPMVERGIEDYARANEITLVDEDILADVRSRFGF